MSTYSDFKRISQSMCDDFFRFLVVNMKHPVQSSFPKFEIILMNFDCMVCNIYNYTVLGINKLQAKMHLRKDAFDADGNFPLIIIAF
jgi:hypothetical protein